MSPPAASRLAFAAMLSLAASQAFADSKPLATVDLKTKEPARAHYERSDICVVPAAGVVGEAMVALVLAGVLLEKFGSDSMAELHRNVESYLQETRR